MPPKLQHPLSVRGPAAESQAAESPAAESQAAESSSAQNQLILNTLRETDNFIKFLGIVEIIGKINRKIDKKGDKRTDEPIFGMYTLGELSEVFDVLYPTISEYEVLLKVQAESINPEASASCLNYISRRAESLKIKAIDEFTNKFAPDEAKLSRGARQGGGYKKKYLKYKRRKNKSKRKKRTKRSERKRSNKSKRKKRTKGKRSKRRYKRR
jgi:hypothetical protein